MVYLVTFDLTIIIVPKPFRPFLGFSVDIGNVPNSLENNRMHFLIFGKNEEV